MQGLSVHETALKRVSVFYASNADVAAEGSEEVVELFRRETCDLWRAFERIEHTLHQPGLLRE